MPTLLNLTLNNWLKTFLLHTKGMIMDNANWSKIHVSLVHQGDSYSLATHKKEAAACHLRLIANSVWDGVERDSSLFSKLADYRTKFESTVRQMAVVNKELSRLHEEMEGQLSPMREGLLKLDATLTHLQESFSDLFLMVQNYRQLATRGSSFGRFRKCPGGSVRLLLEGFYCCTVLPSSPADSGTGCV